MIWALFGIAWAALCFVAYCIICAGGIAEQRAERILRDLRKEAEADATFAALWGDQHPVERH